jgi:hypothetical protein
MRTLGERPQLVDANIAMATWWAIAGTQGKAWRAHH